MAERHRLWQSRAWYGEKGARIVRDGEGVCVFGNTSVPFSRAEVEAQCFDEDTLVVMGDGSLMEIRFMEPGLVVLSRNEETGELARCNVLQVFEHGNVENVAVIYRYDVDTMGAVYTTAQHPFWVCGHGWTPVLDLKIGQKLESHDGKLATIVEVWYTGIKSTVYNLEVSDLHNYFVGSLGVLVHNKNTTNWLKSTELPIVDPM